MNYELYMKSEIEKTLFVEITSDLTINNNGDNILKKGEYPILPKDLVHMAKVGLESVTPAMLLDGMLYMISCDPEFEYNTSYLDFFKTMKGIENYIILNINNAGKEDLKKGLIYSTALIKINPKREYQYNRVLMLMAYYEKLKQDFLTNEILRSLEALISQFPDYIVPHYHLGEYYLDKDMDIAKVHLRICIEEPELSGEAAELLRRIENTENFDEAVEFIKIGRGNEALELLIPLCEEDEENFDAKYYAAVAFRQIQDNQKALQYLRALTDFAERPEVYSEIALNIAQLGDFQTALVYFKKALKITPDDAGVICNIGVCQYSLGILEEAKKTFELANRINPEDEISYKWLVKINAKNKEPKK